MSVIAEARRAQAATDEPKKQYLYGVQGLRTVAALMVAVYHIWFNRVSGGVDVFFVVAGFFAAGSLLKITTRPSTQGRLGAAGQYLLRTARRVIPSAAVVIVGTVVAGVLFLPRSLWQPTFAHGWASLLYVENWYLIQAGHDYLQQGMAASPFQQFWALGIQVQSYVLFVAVALLAAAATRFLRGSVKRGLFLASALILGASLWWSVTMTAEAQPVAYFHLGTRFWEFLAGVLLALVVTNPRAPRAVMAAVGWAGLVAMLLFAAVADPSSQLPGFLALVPILAGAAIIVCAQAGVDPFILRWRPLVWFADSSFAFYLWHWPVLVYYKWQFRETVGPLSGIAIIVVSAGLAIATTWLVEKPVRRWPLLQKRPMLSILVSLALMMPPALSLAAWEKLDEWQTQDDLAAIAAVLETSTAPSGGLVPSTAVAALDKAEAYYNGCHTPGHSAEVKACEGGDLSASTTVAIAGGSHEAQWSDSLARFGEESGFRLVSMTKSGCPFGDVADAGLNLTPSCVEWQESMQDKLIELQPDLLVVMATRNVQGREEFPAWKTSAIERLTRAGVPVLGVRDNAIVSHRVPECIDQKGVAACGFPRASLYLPVEQLDVPLIPGFTFVDPVDDYCDATWCPVARDGLLMFYDDSHFTKTWTLLRGDTIRHAVWLQISSSSAEN